MHTIVSWRHFALHLNGDLGVFESRRYSILFTEGRFSLNHVMFRRRNECDIVAKGKRATVSAGSGDTIGGANHFISLVKCGFGFAGQ
jgi:hypothetical protein